MGFKAKRTIFPIDFTDTPYAGELEVSMRRPSMGAIGDMGQFPSHIDPNNLRKEDVERIARTIGYFTQCLHKWNVEIDVLDAEGEPTGTVEAVPPTAEGIAMLDDEFVLSIILHWMRTLDGAGVIPEGIPQATLMD